jgi:hypothetical protein
MYPANLKPSLTKGVFAPGSITAVSSHCDDWFKYEALPEAFIFRSIFRDLIARGWNDPQGVPTLDFDRFVDDVLPRLNDVLDVLPGDPTAALRDLVLAYHSSL